MNTNMTGFRCFEFFFVFLCFDESSLSISLYLDHFMPVKTKNALTILFEIFVTGAFSENI